MEGFTLLGKLLNSTLMTAWACETSTKSRSSCRGQVAESGEGYTLSGKPLDPTSSAARAYGLKPELLTSAPIPMIDLIT